MSTDDRIRRRSNFRQPMVILGAIMVLVYLGLAAYLLIIRPPLTISDDLRTAFAGLLLVYGFYRGWRIWMDL